MNSRPQRQATGLPTALLQHESRVLRPQDGREVYAHPAAEFRRLADAGVLTHVAHGYYVVVPGEEVGNTDWRPSVEALALAVGVADHGEDAVALMGLSAARLHGGVPRAHATGWLAVEVSRRPLDAGRFGTVRFVTRTVDTLGTVRVRTDLADGWMTSVEQTIVDLARHPRYGGGGDQADAAIRMLWPKADPPLLDEIALAQRGIASLDRATTRLGLR